MRPPSLRTHLDQHTDGDLFYWITNGLPGGMPAWGDKLSETDRWNLINYLRSVNGVGPTPDPSLLGESPSGG
jgi:mono/diheme cytochrome c family protein